MKNYGFKPDVFKPEDHVFGASATPSVILQPSGDWTLFLPVKEWQSLATVETYACVTFAILNCVEALIKRQYGIEKNYSDRFLAAISGTKEGGNSPQAVADALRNKGTVLQDIWPFNQDIDTFEKFYSELPQGVKDLALEFTKEWDFRYENVPLNHDSITAALKCSPLLISVPAWHLQDGKYYRPAGFEDNHATTLFSERANDFLRVFDTYADGKDDPAIKDLEWNIAPTTVKRFWIKKKEEVKQEINIIQKLLGLLAKLITLLKKPAPPDIPATPFVPLRPEVLPKPKYDWSTKENVRHSLRVIGDEMFLSKRQKDLLCDICRCESGFNPEAKLVNSPTSIDRGLFQINSYYHKDATDELAYDPEWNTRWACKAVRNKQAHNLWSASEKCWNAGGIYNDLL